MSSQTNTRLLERAAELIDEYTSHPSGVDDQLVRAVEANDLSEVQRIVSSLEAEQAEEHFHAIGVL